MNDEERKIMERQVDLAMRKNIVKEHQIKHILKLTELALRYVDDCDEICSNCALGWEPMSHSADLPDLPAGLNLCSLFDYISQTMEIIEAPGIKQ